MACKRIGYPIMLKASWGGGGKGIRKVREREPKCLCFVPASPFCTAWHPISSQHELGTTSACSLLRCQSKPDNGCLLMKRLQIDLSYSRT